MEFKKREVKKVNPKQPPTETERNHEQKKEYSFENKVIMASMICEVFEFEEIERVANLAPLKISNSGYSIENRMKSFVYPISEANDIKKLTGYWNSWVNDNGKNKKMKYSIRQMNKPPKEEVTVA
tara:strand:- start:140 stop:514 length:375 start_codon:yes stop_codon:yes gene_type:complete